MNLYNNTDTLNQASQHLQLQQLNGLRAVIIATYSIFLLWLLYIIKEPLNTTLIVTALISYCTITAVSFFNTRQKMETSNKHLFFQLLIDIVLLFFINYLLGGANNPLTSLLLTPIAIAATTLSWQKGAIIAALGVTSYSLLFKFYVPLDIIAPHHQHHGHMMESTPNFHMIGMWINFIVSTGIISFFIYRIAQNTRMQQQQISQLQEKISNDEQLLSIATLAANTAHELGTPLNTITLLSESLVESIKDESAKEDLEDLLSQTLRCQGIIQQLNETAKINLDETISQIKAEDWIDELIDRWQLLKAKQAFNIEKNFAADTIILKHPSLLSTAINLLDNASEAASNEISIYAVCSSSFFKLIIKNNSEKYEHLSLQPTLSDKPYGMGIGLYLSKATIQRFGGEINIYNEDNNTVITELSIPLAE